MRIPAPNAALLPAALRRFAIILSATAYGCFQLPGSIGLFSFPQALELIAAVKAPAHLLCSELFSFPCALLEGRLYRHNALSIDGRQIIGVRVIFNFYVLAPPGVKGGLISGKECHAPFVLF